MPVEAVAIESTVTPEGKSLLEEIKVQQEALRDERQSPHRKYAVELRSSGVISEHGCARLFCGFLIHSRSLCSFRIALNSPINRLMLQSLFRPLRPLLLLWRYSLSCIILTPV